jgi:hypothetical protein
MMVANLTRFLCQSPELFSLIPGRLGRHAVFFRRPMDLGIVTIVIHEITCRQRTVSAAREMSLTGQLRHSYVRAEDQRSADRAEWRRLTRPFIERVHSVAQHDTQEGVVHSQGAQALPARVTLIEQTCETCACTVALRTTQGVLS